MEDSTIVIERTSEPLQEIPQNTATSGSGDCPQCAGTGWTVDEERLARRCACSIEKLIRSRLPQRYWSARIDDFPAAIITRALGWLLEAPDGLRITGPPGTGKTYLAAALVRHRITQNQPAIFLPCSRLYRDLRQSFSDDQEVRRQVQGERSQMERLFNAPFLVLDDLGAGGLSDFERRTLLDILDERINACRPTVMTSNWTLSEICSRMDDRIASRLSNFSHIELAGADRRISESRLKMAVQRRAEQQTENPVNHPSTMQPLVSERRYNQ